jgi:uncharacterized membrane protein YkgB
VGPNLFASIVAIVETTIAVGLLFEFINNFATLINSLLSVVIWFTAERSGGFHASDSSGDH